MAEALGVEVVNNIIDKIGSAAFKKILSTKDLDSNIERLRDIESVIAAALRSVDPFETSNNDVQGPMIARLRRIRDEMVYFFDEQAARTKQKELKSSSNITTKVRSMLPSFKKFTVAEKVNAITSELEKFAKDYALTTSIVACSSGNQNRRTSSLEDTGSIPDTNVFIGRENDKENIIKMLCNSSNDHTSPSVVAIVGVGGQGKTTLAQYVCKDDRVKGSFGKPIWVSTAPDTSVREILEKIIASATGAKPCNYNKEQLQDRLLEAIVGKKSLLVLDNIWYHGSLSSDWLELRALLEEGGFEGSGSKILITTRQKKAAILMGIPSPYMLRDLAEDDSWTLLQRLALVQEKHLDVEEIGKEIAKMCPKLPLVIKVVGLQLAQKDTIRQWIKFKDEFASTSTLYMQNNNEIMPILKLCYDQLSDENLKSCLVYCSLFPKGRRYNTNYMARYWMALEFLKPDDEFSLEVVGEECVMTLANLGFFELDEHGFKYFKMHDVMHDLFLLIGNSTHQVINSETKKISNGVRYVSLNVEDLNWEVLSKFRGRRNLESIISVSHHRNHCSIQGSSSSGFDKFISSCPKLKILEVSSRGIEKVPDSFSKMVHLRYLNLSGNPLKKLPNSITQLKNLLSLDVSYCLNLHELPKGITELDKLEELKIRGKIIGPRHRERGTLSHMPKGIGKLSNLENLDLFVVVGEDRSISGHNSKASGGANLEELGCVNNLQGDLWIIVEGESKHLVSEAKRTKPLEKKTELIRLVVEFKNSTEEDEMLFEGLRPHGKNLEFMTIVNYGGKKLPSWMMDDHFPANFPKLGNIVFLYDDKYQYWDSFTCILSSRNAVLIMMRNVEGHDGMLEWVPGHSRLKEQSRLAPIDIELTRVKGNGLKGFTLLGLEIKKHISQSLLVDLNLETRSFLNIQGLELNEIPELEAIPDEFQLLSSLKCLRIYGWPNLKAIPDWIGSFTALRHLWVQECPRFESLPHHIGSLTSLRHLDIFRCPKLESLPHQIGNLSEPCGLLIRGCSQVLVEKCWKPTGEYWPFIQHLCYIYITSPEGDQVEQGDMKTWREKNRKEAISNAPPAHLTSNTISFKPYLFFILAFIMLSLPHMFVVLFCFSFLRIIKFHLASKKKKINKKLLSFIPLPLVSCTCKL